MVTVAAVVMAVMVAAVAAAEQGEAPAGLPLSSRQCWEPPAPPGVPRDAKAAWCRVSNLYLYRGGAYYLTQDASEQLPTVQYGMQPRVPQAILPADFRALLAQARAAPTVVPVERAHIYRSTIQGKACSVEETYLNFGDGMTERITALWMFLCEVMGHCSYADRRGLQLIDAAGRNCRPDDPPSAWDTYPPWYQQVMSCMSDQPVRHLNGSWRESVVHIGTAWVGQGQRCRSHYGHCHDGSRGKLGPTPELLGAWRGVLGRCLGFPTDAAAPLDPVRVLIVDRTYESHRHLLNVNTLLRALRQHYSSQRVQLDLQYMEGLSVSEQFQLWSRQTVVVHVHGSTIGHWQGLPHGAVVVKIAPLNDTYDDMAYGNYLARDYGPVNNLTWLPLVNSDPNYLHLATEDRPLSDFSRTFSDADKLVLLRADCEALRVGGAREQGRGAGTGAVAGQEEEELSAALKRKFKTCMKTLRFAMNLVVRPEALLARVDEAIGQAFAKQGRPLPPDLLAAAGGLGPAGEGRSQQQQQAVAMAQLAWTGSMDAASAMRGRLHPPSAAMGAAAATGGFLLLQARRRWLGQLPGRRNNAHPAPLRGDR